MRAGTLILTTGDSAELAGQMLQRGIDRPTQLIEAAEHWGVVDIREEENPAWRGG